MTGVFIVSGVRTAVGTFGRTFKDTPPIDLATAVAGEAMRRAAIPRRAMPACRAWWRCSRA